MSACLDCPLFRDPLLTIDCVRRRCCMEEAASDEQQMMKQHESDRRPARFVDFRTGAVSHPPVNRQQRRAEARRQRGRK